MFKLNGNFWVFLTLQFYTINQSQILTYLPVNYPFCSWCVTNITQVAFGLTLLLINSTQKIQKDFSSPSYWEDMTSINTRDRISKADYECKAWAPHDVRGETQLQRADLWLMLFMYSHTNIQHMQINKKSKIIQTKVWFLVKFYNLKFIVILFFATLFPAITTDKLEFYCTVSPLFLEYGCVVGTLLPLQRIPYLL